MLVKKNKKINETINKKYKEIQIIDKRMEEILTMLLSK